MKEGFHPYTTIDSLKANNTCWSAESGGLLFRSRSGQFGKAGDESTSPGILAIYECSRILLPGGGEEQGAPV